MGLGLNHWRVLAASVEGSGHRRSQTGCQDAHAWTVLPEDTLVAAVADGAGSARRAAEGSQRAANFAVEYVAWRLCEHEAVEPPDLLIDAMSATRALLARTAKAVGHPLNDLATTLALVIASPDGVWAGQIGDGTVVVAGSDGALSAIADGQRQEYLNETTFLTSKDWRSACAVEYAPAPVESIALLTDGLGLLALDLSDGITPHTPFFQPLLGFARRDDACPTELETFLGSERVATRTDDDVTLVLATLS